MLTYLCRAIIDTGRGACIAMSSIGAMKLEHTEANKSRTQVEREWHLSHDSERLKANIQELANNFKVLGDPTRLRILQALMHGERCVRELADGIQMEQSAVSHQLRTLRDAGLVNFRRDGKVVYYSLADAHVFTLLSVGIEHVAE